MIPLVQFSAVGGAGVVIVSFSTVTIADYQVDPTNAQAAVEFRRDGTIYRTITEGTTYLADWIVPKYAAVGDGYWIRVTATVGTFTSSSGAGWLQLSSTRTWAEQTVAPGTEQTTFTVEIATDSGGSNIVFTLTGNTLTAERIV
jgi:hypothetical protein